MKKFSIIIISILLLTMLYGCGENNTNEGTVNTFIGGTRGIEASFGQMGTLETGTEYVWVGESFPVEVTIRNVGEHPLPANSVQVSIMGIDTSLFNLNFDNMQNVYDIESISELNRQGGEESISFGQARLDQMTGLFLEANFNARIEYPYKTFVAVPKTCFKYDLRDSSLCNPASERSSSSSAAPIVVSKVIQESAGSKRIALRFEVENRGGGRSAAEGETITERQDTLNFRIVEGNEPINFECTSMGNTDVARLNGGKGTIICRSGELPEGTLYEKQVTLELSYTYRESIQKTLRIRNEPN